MYFFARTKNVAIVKTKFEWDMSNCIAMYTSHLLHFTYSIKIKIIIIGKHVLNEPPPPPLLDCERSLLHTPKKVIYL